jgi:predicted NBD/HSP70 family sugar kinase
LSASPGSLEGLRQGNRLRVIGVLERRAQASRAEIARETGLSPTAVTSLVADLVAEGLVVERRDSAPSPMRRNGGRPPTLLSLDPSSGGFAGVYFAHDSVRAAVVDRSGTLLLDAREDLDVDHRPEQALARAEALTAALVARSGLERERIGGLGVAVSAPLRSATGVLAQPSVLPGWVGVEVAAALEARLRLPVHVGNDANLGGLAEAAVGAGRAVRNLIYVMLSAGVGAALILDGRLYEGATGTAGELGHIVIDPDGEICRCGNRGCLETVSSSTALIRDLAAAHGTSLTFPGLIELLQAGDPPALRAIADAGRAVGRALAAICTMLDPGTIVIGGELAAGGEALLAGIRESIDRETSATGRAYEVVRGSLGPTAEVLGAALLAMRSSGVSA